MMFMKKVGMLAFAGLVAVGGLSVATQSAQATQLPFEVIGDVNGDFTGYVDISCDATGCDLSFVNTSPDSGIKILEVNLEGTDDPSGFATWFDGASIGSQSGANFDLTMYPGGNPPDSGVPPLSDPWTGTWLEGKASPANDDGAVNPGDTLVISLAFAEGVNYLTRSDIRDIMAGQMILVHVGNCNLETGDSCSAVATPIPGAIWLFGSALLGLVGFGARRRRMTA